MNPSPDPFTRTMEVTSCHMEGGLGLNPPTWEIFLSLFLTPSAFILGLEPRNLSPCPLAHPLWIKWGLFL